ncbi:MAG: hydantoinase B/oxoprolinase family protein [Gammaproteobacteria bacterium]|nr:hydantoinase B/oxoprolinase family protein [Gammaproteobacteria bacterium]
MRLNNKWEFWVDRGGTFTDIVALQPDGEMLTHKLLSESPGYRDAAIQGIRNILKIPVEDQLPIQQISAVKMGTTVATNALLERTGDSTLLVTTRGFRDQLRIGYQTRPDLFALDIQLPEMLYCDVLEVNERLDAHGKVIEPLDEEAACLGMERYFHEGIRSVAIVLMHGYRYTLHEDLLQEIAKSIGYTQISVSHQVSPLMKYVPRGDTTVVDAYLSPVIRQYVTEVAGQLGGSDIPSGKLKLMRSNGGLADARFFYGKDAILSGPAGGVVGMARISEAAGFNEVIGFDMGGTSTDVSHYNGEFEKSYETEVAGVRLRAPMMMIHTVAAGGGSILHFDGARYRVGPDSAGAHPGPVCYRNNGPLTITDCNVMIGKLQPDLFPCVFGEMGDQPIDAVEVRNQFTELSKTIRQQTDDIRSPEEVASGFLAVAVGNMSNAIKKISVQRGYDVTRYTLCCFGGAGGQHACMVADALGMNRILVHKFSGILSAYGMGLADTVVDRQLAIEERLTEDLVQELTDTVDELKSDCDESLAKQVSQIIQKNTDYRIQLHVRYEGSDTSFPIEYAPLEHIQSQFEKVHRMRFGFISPDKELIVESIQVEAMSKARSVVTNRKRIEPPDSIQTVKPITERYCYMDGEWHKTPFFEREALFSGYTIQGPSVILESTGTLSIEPGWQATLDETKNLLIERYLPRKESVAIGTDVDPVMLEVFNNLFMSIAEQMGSVLENTAVSVNIKERLDFSCAIFDPEGALVANAPHMPVHLGSMSESIKTVIRERFSQMQPGDAYILNAPYNGGTHLPDVTIIRPVFSKQAELLFFTASRGHHADIGGKSPGSAPADSTHIEEEGVVIDNEKLVENGEFKEQSMRDLLASGLWPARNPDMNIADFKAQLAACEKGAQELLSMIDWYGVKTVHAYMKHVQNNAEESVRRVLDVLNDGQFTYYMDDGHQISVKITVDHSTRRAVVDFTGTSDQHPGNFNAPTAVVRAAVLYVFRCLVNDQIPLNEGCLKPLEIIIPRNSMINPKHPAAVIAGNVETSQYLVDTLFGALGTVAAAQGTMNNFIWGNDRIQYYETVCGGSGAGANYHGTHAVHTHMTNSRLTDPEVLEWRFPVRVESFEIRKGSGGRGRFNGGDGVTRKIRFNEAVSVNIISGHRQVPPYGLDGGQAAQVGSNWVEHVDSKITQLTGSDSIELESGDIFVIETPGGGGFGAPSS